MDNDGSHSWLAVPDNETERSPLEDMQVAVHAVQTLANISQRRATGDARRFFVAVGFHKPHLPFVFPVGPRTEIAPLAQGRAAELASRAYALRGGAWR